jgi:hypothetical protein
MEDYQIFSETNSIKEKHILYIVQAILIIKLENIVTQNALNTIQHKIPLP